MSALPKVNSSDADLDLESLTSKRQFTQAEIQNLNRQGYSPRGNGFVNSSNRFVSDAEVETAASRGLGNFVLGGMSLGNLGNASKSSIGANITAIPTKANNDNTTIVSVFKTMVNLLAKIDTDIRSQISLQKSIFTQQMRMDREDRLERKQGMGPTAEDVYNESKDATPSKDGSGIAGEILGGLAGAGLGSMVATAVGSAIGLALAPEVLIPLIISAAGYAIYKNKDKINESLGNTPEKHNELMRKSKEDGNFIKDHPWAAAFNRGGLFGVGKEIYHEATGTKNPDLQPIRPPVSVSSISGISYKDQLKSFQNGGIAPVTRSVHATASVGNVNSKDKQILDMIASAESSGGSYDTVYGGRHPGLTDMTIGEVKEYQRENGRRRGSSAVGRYQFLSANLSKYQQKLHLSDSTKFSPQVQDALALVQVKEQGLDAYRAGRMSKEQFLHNLSTIWAGLPDPQRGGGSHYAGVGNNKATISQQSAMAWLGGEAQSIGRGIVNSVKSAANWVTKSMPHSNFHYTPYKSSLEGLKRSQSISPTASNTPPVIIDNKKTIISSNGQKPVKTAQADTRSVPDPSYSGQDYQLYFIGANA